MSKKYYEVGPITATFCHEDGTEIKPMTDKEIEEYNKAYKPTLCGKCNYNISESHDRGFLYNGTLYCKKCWNKLNIKVPFFINEIPNFVDGGTYEILTFDTEKGLYQKLIDNEYISKDEILVKSDNNILLTQNIKKKYWWVIGYLCNFNAESLNIPNVNYDIYDKEDNIILSKYEEMIKGKQLIETMEDNCK